MVRVMIKLPNGKVVDKNISGELEDDTLFHDVPNGSVLININGQRYITHFSNVCLIEIPDDSNLCLIETPDN